MHSHRYLHLPANPPLISDLQYKIVTNISYLLLPDIVFYCFPYRFVAHDWSSGFLSFEKYFDLIQITAAVSLRIKKLPQVLSISNYYANK